MIEEHKTKLEIGCGEKRPYRSDFIGLDRFALPGVDVVFDLDSGDFPFPDNEFDLIYASHALEHVRDLQAVMQELWRIMKPGAQLCILAPYYSTTLNFANPYHKQAFNEHTPRFWTASPDSRIDPVEYSEPPSGVKWGLASSDNSQLEFDFHCFRMEFFYFRKYSGLSPRKLRELRRTRNGICHSILYHLMVFKTPMTEMDLKKMELAYYMPPEVDWIRRETTHRTLYLTIGRYLKIFLKRYIRRRTCH